MPIKLKPLVMRGVEFIEIDYKSEVPPRAYAFLVVLNLLYCEESVVLILPHLFTGFCLEEAESGFWWTDY